MGYRLFYYGTRHPREDRIRDGAVSAYPLLCRTRASKVDALP